MADDFSENPIVLFWLIARDCASYYWINTPEWHTRPISPRESAKASRAAFDDAMTSLKRLSQKTALKYVNSSASPAAYHFCGQLHASPADAANFLASEIYYPLQNCSEWWSNGTIAPRKTNLREHQQANLMAMIVGHIGVLVYSVAMNTVPGIMGYLLSGSSYISQWDHFLKRKIEKELQSLLAFVEIKPGEDGVRSNAEKHHEGAATVTSSMADRNDLPPGRWLFPPTTLVELRLRLGLSSEKKVKACLKRFGLRVAGNRQLWTVKLDGMDQDMERKLKGEN